MKILPAMTLPEGATFGHIICQNEKNYYQWLRVIHYPTCAADLGGFAAANDLVGKSDVEVREAIGDKFPKHIYHSIVCIGALIAHWEPDHWAVDAVGALLRWPPASQL